MSLTGKKTLYEHIAYVMILVIFLFIIILDIDVFYINILASLLFGLVLYLNWEDLRNYKEQSPLHKLWLRFVIVGSLVIFFSFLVAIFAVIFGYYQ